MTNLTDLLQKTNKFYNFSVLNNTIITISKYSYSLFLVHHVVIRVIMKKFLFLFLCLLSFSLLYAQEKPKGKFTNYRDIVTVFLLAVFFVVPFIKLNGNPLLKINIIDREFFIIGQPFYPQDFFILALGAITSLVFIILFTVVFGRIFCGWICPQTIFMEGVFRKIEYWIEGDRNKQIKLANQPWNSEKILKKGLKWFIYTIISPILALDIVVVPVSGVNVK